MASSINSNKYSNLDHRSLKPAQDAASVLQRYRDDNPSHQIPKLQPDPKGPPPDDGNADNTQQQPGMQPCRVCWRSVWAS